MEGVSEESQGPGSGLIWITGFSGSGKTTVARIVERTLREAGRRVVFLDGDDLRSIFARKWGYARADRVELAGVYVRLCSHLVAQGHTVVLAAVAMFEEVADWVRSNVPGSRVVLLDVPRQVRVDRDAGTKGVYAGGHDPETGYDVPTDPDLRIPNFGDVTAEDAARRIVGDFLRHAVRAAADHGRSAHWDCYYSGTTGVVEPTPFALDVVKSIGPGRRILEVGCGNGRDTGYLSSLGHDVIALDVSSAAVDLCRRRLGSAADVRLGSITDHAADLAGSRDVLYGRFVLHAMTETEEQELWAGASQVLRPQGEAYVECRSINDPLARHGEVLSPTERLHGHYRRFIVLGELRQRMEAAGFEIREAVEGRGLAAHGDEDPVVLRVRAVRGADA